MINAEKPQNAKSHVQYLDKPNNFHNYYQHTTALYNEYLYFNKKSQQTLRNVSYDKTIFNTVLGFMSRN